MGWRGNDISNRVGSPQKESLEAVRAVLTGRGCCVGTQGLRGVSGAVTIPGGPSQPRHFSLGTSLPPSSDPKAKRSVYLPGCSDKWAGANENSLCPPSGPCCGRGPGAGRSCARAEPREGPSCTSGFVLVFQDNPFVLRLFDAHCDLAEFGCERSLGTRVGHAASQHKVAAEISRAPEHLPQALVSTTQK